MRNSRQGTPPPRDTAPGVLARRLPIGAEVQPGGGVHFRVWAPRRGRVSVLLDGGASAEIPLGREADGYYSGWVADAGPETRYRYRLDGDDAFPDPASRFQPEGPHGPSMVVDPGAFRWTDGAWQGVRLPGQVIYELHVGAFTAEGTWTAAARELGALAELGITLVELMPVADFPGRFGWGYDGVDLFAPTRLYGTPDDFRAFVDRAHTLRMGVLLDVVYNHLGPDGNYLGQYSEHYVAREPTQWGEALNFDGPCSGPVREFFLANAGYWVDEFHVDGLRLDATHAVRDSSDDHILAAIGRRVRECAGGRGVLVVAENEPLDARQVRPEREGGLGLDAMWNDDFHHSAVVALTGRREGYYADFHGTPQELVSTVKHGILFQGQPRPARAALGTSAGGVASAQLVTFLENHDQIAHSGRGLRLHALAQPGCWRAATALVLLAPGTPMLFMGEEFAASSPFLFFADHTPDLARLVREGRAKFLAQFASLAAPAMQAQLADPGAPSTFERCKLDRGERDAAWRGTGPHADALALHRDLIRLRREDATIRAQGVHGVDGAVLGERAFVLRFFGGSGAGDTAAVAGAEDRLLVVNFGVDLSLVARAEPLLAPPLGLRWALGWSSEDPRYGGGGTSAPAARGLLAAGASAMLLVATAQES
ncbi:MAG TPA: malto-oligosyltrehalose trehalohydrolase [Gemmatimonadales bacterium]|nr:malto-oligosyltrehalose trehalohydrolase [Gemmatimonadales bacterium]